MPWGRGKQIPPPNPNSDTGLGWRRIEEEPEAGCMPILPLKRSHCPNA